MKFIPPVHSRYQDPILHLRQKEGAPWYGVVILLAICGYFLPEIFQIAKGMSGFMALALWIVLITYLAVGVYSLLLIFERRSIYIVRSQPPIVVTEISWLDHFTIIKEKSLAAAESLGARPVFDGLISIEAHEANGLATTIMCVHDTRENIAVANSLCAEIASFLDIESRGYNPKWYF